MRLTSRFLTFSLFVAALLLLGANPTDPETWDSSYESSPASGDSVSQGDNWMIQMKKETRRRLDVEHQVGSSAGVSDTTGDNAAHRVGSGRIWAQDDEPTALENSAILLDNTAPTGGTGTLATVETNDVSGASGKTVGHGRMWLDTTDFTLHVYQDEIADASTLNYGFTQELSAPRNQGPNLVRNGNFSAEGIQTYAVSGTDNNDFDAAGHDCATYPVAIAAASGETAAGGANGYVDLTCAKLSSFVGWTALATPTLYQVIDASAELAAVYRPTGASAYQGVVRSDASGDGIQQTLYYLEASTQYMFTSTVHSVNGGSTCTINATGEDTTANTQNLPKTHTGGTTPTKLSGFFTTDGSATDVVLQLSSSAAGAYDCHWSNVAVRQVIPSGQIKPHNWIYQWETETGTFTTDGVLGPTRELVWGGASCWWKVFVGGSRNGQNVAIDMYTNQNAAGFVKLKDSVLSMHSSGTSHHGTWLVIRHEDLDAVYTPVSGAGYAIQFVSDDASNNWECDIATTDVSSCRIIVEQTCSN